MIWTIIILIIIVLILFFISKHNKKSKTDSLANSHQNLQDSKYQEWIAQFDPENSTEKLRSFHTKVAGVTYNNEDGSNRQKIISQCKVGEKLMLIPDPTNKYDENAVKICRINGQQIGHLNANLAYEIKELIEKYKSRVDATISDITGQKTNGVNLLIQKYNIKNRPKQKKKEPVSEKQYDPTFIMHRNSFERSMQAKDLEDKGYLDNAIEMYETIVDRSFNAPFSYNRLAIIYRKRKEFDKEITVINKLIKMYENSKAEKEYVQPQIDKLQKRLQKAIELKEKNK